MSFSTLCIFWFLFYDNLLYRPTTCWQLGQVWTTSLQASTQNGIRQHPSQHPTKHNPPAAIQVRVPVSYEVPVMISALHLGQFRRTGTSRNSWWTSTVGGCDTTIVCCCCPALYAGGGWPYAGGCCCGYGDPLSIFLTKKNRIVFLLL